MTRATPEDLRTITLDARSRETWNRGDRRSGSAPSIRCGRCSVIIVTGHVNRHGWIVRHSIESDDHWLCVDFFEDPAGGFGFEPFRSDPATGGWTPISGYSALRFATIA